MFENTPGILNYQTMIDPGVQGNLHACLAFMKVNHGFLQRAAESLTALPEGTQLSTLTGSKYLAAIINIQERTRLQSILADHVRTIAGIGEIEIIDLIASYKYDGAWNIHMREE